MKKHALKSAAAALAIANVLSAGGLVAGPAISPLEEGEPAPALFNIEPIAEPAPAKMAASDEPATFEQEEAALKAAILRGDDPVSAHDALARFYAHNALYPEALDAALAIDAAKRSDAINLLIAESQFALGRDEKALAALEDERLASLSAGAAIIAMSHARLGAYEKAAEAFGRSIEPNFVTAAPTRKFLPLKALTAIKTGNLEAATSIVENMYVRDRETSSDPIGRVEQSFLLALLKNHAGEKRAAYKKFRAVANAGVQPFAARAEAAMLSLELGSRERSPAETLSAAQQLRQHWSGGAFDREIAVLIAESAEKSGALPVSIEAHRQVVRSHPQSDLAFHAQTQITNQLSALFAPDAALSPAESARVFYENVEFAPPGAEGDALIRKVTAELKALDLHGEAAELLEHQVFNRLRGAERSTVAADLAQFYLDSGAPREALRVIRSTRIAGLPEDVNKARRLIEASALAKTARSEDALNLLEAGASLDDIRLRAAIYWDAGKWEKAGKAYASVVSAEPSPLNAPARKSALRAAAAYLLAGREAEFQGFASDAVIRLKGTPEEALLQSLRERQVDGELAAGELDQFMNSYREIFKISEPAS